MKLEIPAKTVEVCDLCQREGTVQPETCVICGKLFCYWCRTIIVGCWVEPHVCKRCGERDDVKRIVDRYSPDFEKLVKERDAALRRLRKKETT